MNFNDEIGKKIAAADIEYLRKVARQAVEAVEQGYCCSEREMSIECLEDIVRPLTADWHAWLKKEGDAAWARAEAKIEAAKNE